MQFNTINVAPDAVGQTVPTSIRPVAVITINGVDYQVVIPGPIPAYDDVAITWTAGTENKKVSKREFHNSGSRICTETITYGTGDDEGLPVRITYTYDV